MYHYFLNAQLYIISLLFSFYLSSVLIKNKYINNDTTEDDLLEKKMIENSKIYLFQFNYLDELENLDNSYTEINKNNITTLEIPFLNNKIIMFYDTDKKAFCYYTKGDVIYKYLNVACRKYVIEHNCKYLYLSDDNSESDIEHKDTEPKDTEPKDTEPKNTEPKDTEHKNTEVNKGIKNMFLNNCFIKKVEKKLLTKKTNKFISCGSLEDYEKTLITNTNPKNISIQEYLSMNSSF